MENKNSSKKFPNRNLVLAVLGVIALITLILIFQYTNKEKPTEEPTYIVQEETPGTGQNTEPFSSIDIDGDGDEEQVPREIMESKILMLTQKGELFIISPVDKERTLLLENVSAYASSNDKNYIAYLKSCPLTGDQSNCDRDIHIYNIKTKQESIITAGASSQRTIAWSPDGRYIIVDSGTSAITSYKVYSVETGSINTCNFSGNLIWVSDVEVLAPIYSSSLAERPGEISEAVGIKKVNIDTCQTETVIGATNTEDFYPIKIIDNQLIVRKRYVDRVEDWLDSSNGMKTKETYEKYDLQTKQRNPYPEYSEELSSENKRLRSLVPYYVNVKNIFTSAKDIATGWELINVYKGMSLYNNEIYLMGPDKTVVKIGEDAFATWL